MITGGFILSGPRNLSSSDRFKQRFLIAIILPYHDLLRFCGLEGGDQQPISVMEFALFCFVSKSSAKHCGAQPKIKGIGIHSSLTQFVMMNQPPVSVVKFVLTCLPIRHQQRAVGLSREIVVGNLLPTTRPSFETGALAGGSKLCPRRSSPTISAKLMPCSRPVRAGNHHGVPTPLQARS